MDKEANKIYEELYKIGQETQEMNKELSKLAKSMNDLVLAKFGLNTKLKLDNSSIIKFNIGGAIFATLKNTITKKIKKSYSNDYYGPNRMEMLINGQIDDLIYDDMGNIFIDRNPKYFIHILDYLRNANSDLSELEFPTDSESIEHLFKEAEFYKIEGIIELFYKLANSVILSIKLSRKLCELCNFSAEDKWELVYRGSLHGFGSKDFHSKCDGVSKTLTIIKTKDSYIFGGYTEVAWDQSDTYKLDLKSFIFSLVNKSNKPIKIDFNIINGNKRSIYCGHMFGPTFGSGHDIHISNGSNENLQNTSNVGSSFKHPNFEYNSSDAKSFLAGAHKFLVNEIEVFSKKS